jgi:hypothetical protein
LLDGRASLRPNFGMREFELRPTLGELQRTTPWIVDGFADAILQLRNAFRGTVGMPPEVMQLMSLYPRPIQRSAVEYLPIDIPRQRRV